MRVFLIVFMFFGCLYKPQIPKPDGIVRLPLYHLGSAHRFVKAEISGRSWLFLIDTGAAESAITPRAASQMKVHVRFSSGELNGIGGKTEAAHAKIPSLFLQELEFRRMPVRVVSISTPFVENQPDLVAGYLGSDFFNNYHMGLDLAGGELYLAKPGTKQFFPGAPIRIPLLRIHGEMRIITTIERERLDLEVDTGADRLVLFRNETKIRGEPMEIFLAGVGPGAMFPAEIAYIKYLSLGGIELFGVTAIIVDRDRQKSGLLGADILANFLIELDPTQKDMLLWPRPPANGSIDARIPETKKPGPAMILEGSQEIEIH